MRIKGRTIVDARNSAFSNSNKWIKPRCTLWCLWSFLRFVFLVSNQFDPVKASSVMAGSFGSTTPVIWVYQSEYQDAVKTGASIDSISANPDADFNSEQKSDQVFSSKFTHLNNNCVIQFLLFGSLIVDGLVIKRPYKNHTETDMVCHPVKRYPQVQRVQPLSRLIWSAYTVFDQFDLQINNVWTSTAAERWQIHNWGNNTQLRWASRTDTNKNERVQSCNSPNNTHSLLIIPL